MTGEQSAESAESGNGQVCSGQHACWRMLGSSETLSEGALVSIASQQRSSVKAYEPQSPQVAPWALILQRRFDGLQLITKLAGAPPTRSHEGCRWQKLPNRRL